MANRPTYTLAERRAINNGWETLMDFARSHGLMDDARRLHDALTEERRQTQDLIAAKGLLLGALLHAGNLDRDVLWGLRAAHRDLTAYSWRMHDTCKEEVSAPDRTTWCDVLQAAAEAEEQYRQAKQRFFEGLAFNTSH